MITLHYFASIREALNCAEETIDVPRSVNSVALLIAHLTSIKPHYAVVFHPDKKVLVAVDQVVVDFSFALTGTEEVAFFPPMTGG